MCYVLFTVQLAVECIFCSACIRFVECCPQEGITGNSCLYLDLYFFLPLLLVLQLLMSYFGFFLSSEKLWFGLEDFVFDWLINADRWGSWKWFINFVCLNIYFLLEHQWIKQYFHSQLPFRNLYDNVRP